MSSTIDRKEQTRKLREYHQSTLDAIGAADVYFLGKLFYIPKGKSEKYIAFFHSEVSKGNDIYLEDCDRDNNPQDPERTLYKYKYNPHFEEEYEKTEPATNGAVRYLVPVMELQTINVQGSSKTQENGKVKIKTNQLSVPDPEEDLPIGQMTVRDFAAIMLKEPVSRREWLNDLIKRKR